jgi:signal transduction histidine kinase
MATIFSPGLGRAEPLSSARGAPLFRPTSDVDAAGRTAQYFRLLDPVGAPGPAVAALSWPPVDRHSLINRMTREADGVARSVAASDGLDGAQAVERKSFRELGIVNGLLNFGLSENSLMFSGISLLACVCLAFLALRCRWQLGRYRRQRDAELSIREAMTRVSIEPAAFDASMNEALAGLREVFGFRSAHLVELDPATWTVGRSYGGQVRNEEASALVQDFVSELRITGEVLSAHTLCRWHPRPQWKQVIRRLLHGRAPIAIASAVIPTDRQAIMLIGESWPDRPGTAPDPLVMRAAVDLFAATLERHARLVEAEQLKASLSATGRLEAVSAFAGTMAHEFNNLLTAIVGYAEIAVDAVDAIGPESTTRWYIENIIDAGGRAREVIDQILTFSRKRRNPAEPFDLTETIAQILPALYLAVPQGVRLTIQVPECPLVIAGSMADLEQILVNLCKNAGDAFSGEGEVVLAVEAVELQAPRSLSHGQLPSGKYVRVAVADNGPGIPSEHLPRVFEPFFTTKAERGAGLGLSVVHGVVHSWKGAVHVHSASGEGARFELFFPHVAHDEERPEDDEARPEQEGELRRISAGADRLMASIDALDAPGLAVGGGDPR